MSLPTKSEDFDKWAEDVVKADGPINAILNGINRMATGAAMREALAKTNFDEKRLSLSVLESDLGATLVAAGLSKIVSEITVSQGETDDA